MEIHEFYEDPRALKLLWDLWVSQDSQGSKVRGSPGVPVALAGRVGMKGRVHDAQRWQTLRACQRSKINSTRQINQHNHCR